MKEKRGVSNGGWATLCGGRLKTSKMRKKKSHGGAAVKKGVNLEMVDGKKVRWRGFEGGGRGKFGAEGG